jgi:endonuclease/exonuclease/phosphatase family metal-dependent hydrolase
MNIKLASWNLRNLSKKRTAGCVARLSKLFSEFDLLALQEVRDETIVQNICQACGYNYVLSPPLGTGQKRKEMYAFVFNHRVTCLSHAVLEAQDTFVRAPFLGFFRISALENAECFDFVLATIHLVWGTKGDRREEASHLGPVIRSVFDRAGREHDVILCGDFNTCPGEFTGMPTGWRNLRELVPLLRVGGTTINTRGELTGNMYDNIWINTTHTGEFVTGGIREIDNLKELSDHLPVWAEFRNTDDDEEEFVNLNNLRI